MDDIRSIEEIRSDIERTRARLRDTSEALGHKADMPARVIALVGEAAELAGEWLRDRVPSSHPSSHPDGGRLLEAAGGAVSSATESVGEGLRSAATGVSRAASAASDGVREAAAAAADHAPTADDARAHPMLVGALALVAGLAAGLALPSSGVEETAARTMSQAS